MEVKSFIGTHNHDWEDPGLLRHKYLEVAMILEGKGIFRTDVMEQTVEAGQIVFIPSRYPHSFHALSPIRFGVILMADPPIRIKVLFEELVPHVHPKIVSLSNLDKDQFELLFRQWLKILSTPLKEIERTCSAWIEVLMLFIHNHASGEKLLSLSRIATDIRENLKQPVLISELAARSGLSEDGFRSAFHKMYGMSPKQYQQQCRMDEVKWLLRSSDKDMKTIAAHIGFSLHAFSAWFKRMEGVSPTEWRNRHDFNLAYLYYQRL